MQYTYSMVHVTNGLENGTDTYSISLIEAREMAFSLNGTFVILSGKYLFCICGTDVVTDIKGDYTAKTLSFIPYFYNINLNEAIMDEPVYEEMREKYGYPDFYLFRSRGEHYRGIIKLTDGEYESIFTLIQSAERHIAENRTDGMWSCRTRSDMIDILRIAEAAHLGRHADTTNEVLRYIRANPRNDLSLPALCKRFGINRTTLSETIKELTGLSPGRYVLSERLGQSRPDLLFTQIPLEEISEKYGFSDVNYYIRAFKNKYGVTPLQYRKNGVEKRIREEKNYHLKNGGKGLMSVEDFKEYLRKGLGIAIIRLRREPDRSRFREAFRDHITGGKRYSARRHCFLYEDELIGCFEDCAEIKEELVSYFISSGKLLTPYQVCLIKRWCAPEQLVKLKEALGTVYENCYRRVFDAAGAISDKSLYKIFDQPGITEEKLKAQDKPEIYELNLLYGDYHTEFDAMTAFDGSLEMIRYLVEMELEMRKATGFVPSNPSCDVIFSLFDAQNSEISNYICSMFPREEYFLKYDLHSVKKLRPSEIEKLDEDYFLDTENYTIETYEAFESEYLPISVRTQVNKALLECKDLKKRNDIMSLFTHSDDVKQFVPAYLISELKAALEDDKNSRGNYTLSSFVFGSRNKKVKEFAKECMENGGSNLMQFGEILLPGDIGSRVFYNAVNSYFVYNYDKSDKELFAKKLSEKPQINETQGFAPPNPYLFVFRNAIEKGIPDLPLEMVLFAFRECTCAAQRMGFVKALYKGGVNDPSVIEEALLDDNSETRRIAEFMRDGVGFLKIEKLNGANASEYVKFFEEKGEYGIDLDRHMSKEELDELLLSPIKNNVFCDLGALSFAVRVKLLCEQRIYGFIAFINKKPVGFIDCGGREKFTYLNELAAEPEEGEFVITPPRTFGDKRVARELIERAVKHARDDECPCVRAYLQKSRLSADETLDEVIGMFTEQGFEVDKQNDTDAVLVLKK